MTKYLITASLINAYQYYINDEYKSPTESRADFLKTLKKESFEPTEAMQRGIKFEADIKAKCEGFLLLNEKEDPDYETILGEFTTIVKGGLWQTKCQKELIISNKTFLLYGKPDVIKKDTIYDIKFTSNYELGKFYNSIQHLIYLYCLDMPKFAYLISDGKEWWREDYFNNNNVECEIKSKITDFLNYLENDLEAKEIFNNKWKTN